MAYTPRLSDFQRRASVAQAELDQQFERVKKSGFLKPPKKKGLQVGTISARQGRNSKTVVVEKKTAPRVSPEQVRQKLAEDDIKRREKVLANILAEAARKRQESEAEQTLRNKALPVEQRIAAAKLLSFAIAFRGPEDSPRRIIFRHPKTRERIAIMLPKGKNHRRQMSQHFRH